MKIQWVEEKEGNKNPHCEVEDNGEVYSFSVSRFNNTGKQRLSTDVQSINEEEWYTKLFVYHNQWFDSLYSGTRKKLMQLYKECYELLHGDQSHSELTIALSEKLVEFMELVDYEQVHSWIMSSTDIRAPSSVNENFDAGENGRNRPLKTYVLKEYLELVSMTFVFRLTMPILGEYLERVSAYMSKALMELNAFDLFENNPIMEVAPMIRLTEYVHVMIPADVDKGPAIIAGVSSSEYEKWVLSLVVLRRLMVGKLQDENDGTSLVSFIHKYILQTTGNSMFPGYLKDKKTIKAAQADVNAESSLEIYRIKARWIPGDVELVKYYLMDTNRVYEDLMSGFPRDTVEKFYPKEPNKEFEYVLSYPIGRGQRVLLQYVMSLVTTHRLINEISRPALVSAMYAAIHFLYAIGQYEIAALMTSVQHSGHNAATQGNKKRRSAEDQELLNYHYPWPRKTQSRQSVVETKTAYERSVEAIEPMFAGQWWLTVPTEVIREFSDSNSRMYIAGSDLRNTLISFFIAIEESRKRFKENRKAIVESIINSNL